jgi:hypothetical protein
MITIIIAILTFIAGALLSGKIVAAWGGLKTDVAAIRTRAAFDISAVHARINELETKIASKLP